ncbi:MAG: EamA family transporter [Patescibacteria group bacterium]|jgi:drug/metabolite transporter (DMT)-like permease
MNWIFVALLEPIFHAFANILDSNLANRLFKNAWLLSLIITVAVTIFTPFVWLLDPPKFFPLHLLPYFIIVGAIELLYVYPYFKALQGDDTSVATSLFSLGKILVPILAFFLIGETLRPVQYAGFLLIIAASVALTFNPKARLWFNRTFFYILLSSALLAVEVVIFKYIFTQVSWGTGYVWTVVIASAIALAALLPQLRRTDTRQELVALKKNYWLILLVGGASFLGNIGFSYAIFAVPATVSRSIDSFQPFFVLLYAILFKRYFPLAFKESTNRRSLIKKIVLFAVMVIGVILTVR